MTDFQSLTIMIGVPDVGEAIQFYVSMGFSVAETDEYHYGEGNINWAILGNGDTTLMLRSGGDLSPKDSLELYIRVPNADAFRDVVGGLNGVEIIDEITDQFYGMRDFWFRDPFGYRWGAGHRVELEADH